MQKCTLFLFFLSVAFSLCFVPYEIYIEENGYYSTSYYKDIQYVFISKIKPQIDSQESIYTDENVYGRFPESLNLSPSENVAAGDVQYVKRKESFRFMPIVSSFLVFLIVLFYSSFRERQEGNRRPKRMVIMPGKFWIIKTEGLRRLSAAVSVLATVLWLVTAITNLEDRYTHVFLRIFIATPIIFSISLGVTWTLTRTSEWIYFGFQGRK